MDILDAIILGIIQGLTEFLPVSSSGHIILFGEMLGVQKEAGLGFTVTLHAGTVMSTIVVFRRELWQLIKGFFKFEMNWETQFILKIFVSLIPIIIVGFTVKDEVELLFTDNTAFIGCMLILTAILLAFTAIKKPGIKEIGYKQAFIIGLAQACAVLPGLSRSGSTIATGMLLGVDRKYIAKFSFLMVLIPILGVSLLDLVSGDMVSSENESGIINLIVGFATSFIVGLGACKAMISLVQKGNLKWFALYCFIVGVIAIFI